METGGKKQMANKINIFKEAPNAMKLMLEFEKYLHNETTLEPKLLELIKMRVSQINRCAYCLDMHTKDALKLGETTQRIFLLNAWRETKLFTDKEKVVLELAERVTLLSTHEIDDALHAEVHKYFTNKEFVDLLIAISQINTWNRYNASLHSDIDKNL